MMLMPLIFLNKEGRKRIGFTKSISSAYYWYAIVSGASLAFICYAAGLLLFGLSADNWFVTIKSSYYNTMDTSGMSLMTLLSYLHYRHFFSVHLVKKYFFVDFCRKRYRKKFPMVKRWQWILYSLH